MNSCAKCLHPISFFSRKFKCRGCNEIFCSRCVKSVQFSEEIMDLLEAVDVKKPEFSITKFSHVLCPTCAIKFSKNVGRMTDAIELSEDVEIVSINYRGFKPYIGPPIEICTYAYKDKKKAEEELKILAKYYSCNMVIHVKPYKRQIEETTEKGGKYIYNVWGYTGEAVVKSL